MIPARDKENTYRARNHSAPPGPSHTFHCALCGNRKDITGRRKINGAWCCAGCVAGAA